MQLSEYLSYTKDRAGSRLLLVVVLLLAAMSVVIANALWQNARLTEELDHITLDRATRIQLSTDLLEAAYNRHQSLINQLLTDDPFERDELRLEYDKWGSRVGEIRRDLRDLLDEPPELAMLAQQDALIPRIVDLQDEVVELLAVDRIGEAMAIVSNELFAIDREFDEYIEALRAYEREQMLAALTRAHTVAEQSRVLTIVLGGSMLLLVILLILLTARALHTLSQQVREKVLQLERLSKELHFQANHDGLTGLLNRRAFFLRMEQAISLAERQGSGLVLAYVDLDNFKPVNDTYGHAAGDQLLKRFAERLQHHLRGHDAVARLGGDEFVILLQDTDSSELSLLAKRIREMISAPMELDALRWEPTFSLGLARYPVDGETAQALLHEADQRMYSEKKAR